MGVILREKKLKGGGISFYLDINHEGRRWYEFLDIHIKGNRRTPENAKNKQLANEALATRKYQLTVEKNHLPNELNKQRDMIAYILESSVRMRQKNSPKHLCQKLQEFTGDEVLPMDKIDKNFLIRFQTYLKESKHGNKRNKPLGQGTIYMLVHRFSTYLYKAVEEGYMNANPFQKIPRTERIKPKRRTPEYLSADEIIQLMENSTGVPQQLKLAFLFSCFCGLRWSDCRKLKWSQISQQIMDGKEETVVRVDQQKTQVGYYIPLPQQAILALEERRKDEKKSPLVFPYLTEGDEKSYARKMSTWGKRAKLEKRLHFHLSRHTFATLTLLEGADLYTVSKLLGHTDIKSTQIYAQVANRLKVQAVARLPKLDVNISDQRKAS